ncbi:hypothetical protein ACRAQ6_09285 [Erythrobacter sp. HA6-11]
MLIRTVEQFLRKHDMAATKFGRLAAHDPRFVLDLRMGRIPRAGTEKRVRQWMEDYSPDRVPPAFDKKTAGTMGYEVKGYAAPALAGRSKAQGAFAHAH